MNSELCECGHTLEKHRMINGVRLNCNAVCDCDCYRPSVSAPQIAGECPACGTFYGHIRASKSVTATTRNDELLAALKERDQLLWMLSNGWLGQAYGTIELMGESGWQVRDDDGGAVGDYPTIFEAWDAYCKYLEPAKLVSADAVIGEKAE